MEIEVRDHESHKILSIIGEISINNIHLFRDALYDLVNVDTKSIIVDMKRLAFLDSSIIGTLVSAQKKMMALKGKFALMHVNNDMASILKASGLSDFFRVFQKKEDLDMYS